MTNMTIKQLILGFLIVFGFLLFYSLGMSKGYEVSKIEKNLNLNHLQVYQCKYNVYILKDVIKQLEQTKNGK